jgi:hypothetical protein
MDGVAEQGKREENVKCNVSAGMDTLVVDTDYNELDDAPDHGEGDLDRGKKHSQLRRSFATDAARGLFYDDHWADVSPCGSMPA